MQDTHSHGKGDMRPPSAAAPDPGADALDAIPDPVIGVGANTLIDLWNRGAEMTYGFTREEALGIRPFDLLRTRFPIPLDQVLATVIEIGHWQGDVVKYAKDGRELTVETRWILRRDEHGNVSGAIAIDRDLSKRLKGEGEGSAGPAGSDEQSRLERLESFGRLAGGIAHDFNNHLAVIINYSAMIASELERIERASTAEASATLLEDLSEIRIAAERAARLTHQLLSSSRQMPSAANGSDPELDPSPIIGDSGAY